MKTTTIKFLRASLAACCIMLLSANISFGQASHLVISQVYGGGGNAGAYWKQDFVELYNGTADTIFLTGWSVQYAAPTGTSWTNKTILSGYVAPGRYFLIQEAAGGNASAIDLPSPDLIDLTPIAMGGTNGKIALCSDTTSLTVSNPTGTPIVDFIGYGTANWYEGGSACAALSNTTSGSRKNNGCLDTDTNSTNFTVGAVNPRNSSTLAWFCATKKLDIATIIPTTPEVGVPFDIIVYSRNGSGVRTNVWYETTLTLTSNDVAGTIGGTVTGTIPAGKDSVLISGITFPSTGTGVLLYATPTAGDFHESDTSALFDVTIASGISDNASNDKISVFNNNSNLVIMLNLAETSDASINVFDISGKLINSTELTKAQKNNVEINTNNWSKGVYMIRVTTKNGTYTNKILL